MDNQEIEKIEVENKEVEGRKQKAESNNRKKICMFHIVGYGVLTAAVTVLFILHFSQPKNKSIPVHHVGDSKSVIVTVNTDSVTEHFELMKLLQNDLEEESKKYEKDLQTKSAAFEEKYRNFQINYQNNVLTQTQIQNAERQLLQEKETLEALSAKYTEIITKKNISVQNEVTDSLRNAAKRVNEASYNADYIFAIGTGSAILYSNEVYDITDEVIKELNNVYKKSTK